MFMRNKARFPSTTIKGRSHFDNKHRQVFINIAKSEFNQLQSDVDGDDRPNAEGILKGTDIDEADRFFNLVYSPTLEKLEQDTATSMNRGVLKTV